MVPSCGESRSRHGDAYSPMQVPLPKPEHRPYAHGGTDTGRPVVTRREGPLVHHVLMRVQPLPPAQLLRKSARQDVENNTDPWACL